MKKVLLLLMLLSIFLIACSSQEYTTQELDQMGDAEFEEVLEQDSQGANIAGNAKIQTPKKSKPALECVTQDERLLFQQGDWQRSLSRFYCISNTFYERECQESGFTSKKIESCESGCNQQGCIIPEPSQDLQEPRQECPITPVAHQENVLLKMTFDSYENPLLDEVSQTSLGQPNQVQFTQDAGIHQTQALSVLGVGKVEFDDVMSNDWFGENFTVAFWFNSQDGSSPSFGFQSQDSYNKNNPFTLYQQTFSFANGESYDSISFDASPAQQWVHYALVKNQRDVMVYVDGNVVNQKTLRHEGIPSSNQSRTFNIGVSGFPGRYTSQSNGLFDEFLIYNTALTEQQIETLMDTQRECR